MMCCALKKKRGGIMCKECRVNPCHPKCPNATPPKTIFYCLYCGGDINESSELWTDDNGNIFCCEECAEKHHGIKDITY